ncbi:hypothetical protein OG422_17600 [Streptomyces sp. NBC_01525]|uniref:hypothetical protein n=1 Tax=Streptomyces sp. NBC_01525 TaxID=2903893 RepID=UPI00386F0B20
MPMPYGTRGGMVFSADELRVLRRALAHARRSTPATPPGPAGPEHTVEPQEYLRLAEAVDEAEREGARLRAFLLADLARYRAALPGAAPGYLARLDEALAVGCVPGADDLAALHALAPRAAGAAEGVRRAGLPRRCEASTGRAAPAHPADARLRALPGARSADEPRPAPHRPAPDPASRPAPRPAPKEPRPERPVPTPGEVFPRRRRPAPPPAARTA